ncbi:hypothetical protein Mlute_01536 [Meiothermus luteus]|uniref:Uncharacterized protein n=1 Tax=Meiothermus luteus TaxID=2026184 RepID=A0A399ELN3_9DEIN|nr:hypothetical protein [Meiothermus luteus]RIH85644.1 hypothetical protein Mlute_01536 [Meiothermus luteus]RMH57203.1 MAG: hypothetical protein D6684_04130 [Deinococcota bacterium]
MDLEAVWAAGRHREGLAWCLRRLQRSPGGLCARYALEFALELPDESLLAQLFNTDNPHPEFLALKSQLLWQRGRLQEALEMAQRAYRQQPGVLTALALGTAVALRSTQEAEAWYKEALRSAEAAGQPHRAVQAAAMLAQLQVLLGAYGQAEAWAQWGLNLAKAIGMRHPGIQNNLYMARGYAQTLGGRLLSLPPLELSQPEALVARGDFWLALGEPEAALETYQSLHKRLSERSLILPLLARKVRALLELGQLEDALHTGRKARTLAEGTLDSFRDWGELAYLLPVALTAPSEAAGPLYSLLKRLVVRRNAPRSAMAALYLAQAYLRLGLKSKAQAILRDAWWALEGLSPSGRAFLAGPAQFFDGVFALLQPTPHLRLHFLAIPTAWLGSAKVSLSPRQQEIVAALALHPNGLSAEGLALWVWGEGGKAETVRTEMQRLRRKIPLLSRPYQLNCTVWADFIDVRERLLQGDLAGALALYGGPFLPGSEAPGAVELREELWSLIKTTLASQGTPGQIYELAFQENDPELWQMALERLPNDDPRQALLKARLKRFLAYD